jgi:phthalate 4,5-cis-dihydrodiol dehydrogenase
LRSVPTGTEEVALKNRRAYGAAFEFRQAPPPAAYNHFGFVVVCCERADLRPTPNGIMIFGEEERCFEALPPPVIPRAEVIDELAAAVFENKPPLHSGEWGLATTEICQGILTSARKQGEVVLHHQRGWCGRSSRGERHAADQD